MQKLNYMQKHTKYAKKAIQKSRHAKFLGTWRARRGARYDFAYFAYLVYLCIFVHISHVLHILYIFAYFAYMIYLCIFCIFCIFCILCIFCIYDIFVHICAYICAYFAYFVYFCIFCSAYQICKNIEYMQNIQYMQKHTIYAITNKICKTNYTKNSASKVLFVAYTIYCCILCIFCLVFNISHVYAYNIESQRAQHTELLGSEIIDNGQ